MTPSSHFRGAIRRLVRRGVVLVAGAALVAGVLAAPAAAGTSPRNETLTADRGVHARPDPQKHGWITSMIARMTVEEKGGLVWSDRTKYSVRGMRLEASYTTFRDTSPFRESSKRRGGGMYALPSRGFALVQPTVPTRRLSPPTTVPTP